VCDHPAATPADQLLDDIQQAAIDPEELTQAFAALLYGFLHLFSDADVDMIVGSVTRRLRRLKLVPEPMVTRMHGAMGAAAAGQSPLNWREQFGPMQPAEALALAYTTWLLADLLDYLGEERGQRERFSDRVVELLLSVDPEPGGGSLTSPGKQPISCRVGSGSDGSRSGAAPPTRPTGWSRLGKTYRPRRWYSQPADYQAARGTPSRS
jgi:hypothetical protein